MFYSDEDWIDDFFHDSSTLNCQSFKHSTFREVVTPFPFSKVTKAYKIRKLHMTVFATFYNILYTQNSQSY